MPSEELNKCPEQQREPDSKNAVPTEPVAQCCETTNRKAKKITSLPKVDLAALQKRRAEQIERKQNQLDYLRSQFNVSGTKAFDVYCKVGDRLTSLILEISEDVRRSPGIVESQEKMRSAARVAFMKLISRFDPTKNDSLRGYLRSSLGEEIKQLIKSAPHPYQ